MSTEFRNMLRDEAGATFVEFVAVITLLLTVLLGFVEFSYAFYQWNTATKATQFGARLAAVSDPVAPGLRSLTGVSSTVLPGMPMPTFGYECRVTSGNLGCSGSPTLSGANNSLTAMQKIVYGRNADGSARGQCIEGETDRKLRGMCNIFSRIDLQNVVVRYDYTGLGYAGRPGGPVPTITVSLVDLTYRPVFLGGLLGLADIPLPSFATTVTGEDLNVAGT